MTTPKRGAQHQTHTSVAGHPRERVAGDPGSSGLIQPPKGPSSLSGVILTHESVLTRYPDLAEETRVQLDRAKVLATERAYTSDWRIFSTWCEEHGASSLPATIDTIVGFLVDEGRTKELATLRRYRATISKAHKRSGFPSPSYSDAVREVMKALAKNKGDHSPRAKCAMAADVFSVVIDPFPGLRSGDFVRDIRDRAILLLGLASALRRSELCALDIEDVLWRDDGIALHIRKSKTDQSGRGCFVFVPRMDMTPDRCPVRALRRWMNHLPEESGPLFRSLWKDGRLRDSRLPARRVANAVHRACELGGLDPTLYGAHSLRAGYVTQARREGLPWSTIMEQTRHTKIETVKRYDRDPGDSTRSGGVDRVFRAFAERDNFGRDRTSGREWRALREALEAVEISLHVVTLPPSSSRTQGFSGGAAHQRLCSSAARWIEQQGKAWSLRPSDLAYAGGTSDVAATDRSVFVEAGNTSAIKVIRAVEAGESILLVPFHDDGIVGYLLSISHPSPSLGRFSGARGEEARKAVACLCGGDLEDPD